MVLCPFADSHCRPTLIATTHNNYSVLAVIAGTHFRHSPQELISGESMQALISCTHRKHLPLALISGTHALIPCPLHTSGLIVLKKKI